MTSEWRNEKRQLACVQVLLALRQPSVIVSDSLWMSRVGEEVSKGPCLVQSSCCKHDSHQWLRLHAEFSWTKAAFQIPLVSCQLGQ